MKSILLVKKVLGLVEMTSRLVNASFSLSEWQAVKMIFFAPCVFVIVMVAFTRAVFTLYWTAFGPTRQLFRIEPLFTHENDDFGAISVTERSRAAPILKVERESLQFLRKKRRRARVRIEPEAWCLQPSPIPLRH